MKLRERILYHQIHPLKLVTDWSAAVAAAGLLWHRQLGWALLVGFAPAVLVSLYLVCFVDLRPQKESRFGRYVGRYMTRPLEAVRFLGLGLFWLAAWYRIGWLLPVGLLVIVVAWLRGVLLPRRMPVGPTVPADRRPGRGRRRDI
jgi:hypothetical protein